MLLVVCHPIIWIVWNELKHTQQQMFLKCMISFSFLFLLYIFQKYTLLVYCTQRMQNEVYLLAIIHLGGLHHFYLKEIYGWISLTVLMAVKYHLININVIKVLYKLWIIWQKTDCSLRRSLSFFKKNCNCWKYTSSI